VQIGIKNEINLIPQDILDKFIGYGYPIVSNLTKSNLTKQEGALEKLEILLPNWLNKESWQEWLEYRKESKKKMTAITVKKQLKFLSLHTKDHVKIIENSISHGWTGLFELQNDFKKSKSDAEKILEKQKEEKEEKKERENNAKDNERVKELLNQSKELTKKMTVD
jgi:hypothetical protein